MGEIKGYMKDPRRACWLIRYHWLKLLRYPRVFTDWKTMTDERNGLCWTEFNECPLRSLGSVLGGLITLTRAPSVYSETQRAHIRDNAFTSSRTVKQTFWHKDLNVYRWDIIMMPKVKKSLTQWSQKRNTMSHSYERWQYSRVPSILPPSVERINYLRREPDLCQFLGRLIVRRRQYALEKVVWSLRATSVYFGSAFI